MRPSKTDYFDAICRKHFAAFAQAAFPIIEPGTTYEHNWHIDCISEHLEATYRGDIKRLIINVPPRSLKSYLVSAAFPAWVMGHDPSQKFINTSYGQTVVEQNARNCRAIMRSEWYQRVFPQTVLSEEMDRQTHFETTQKGQYYAATVLSPLTGLGATYILMDDVLKPMEAFSDTVRASTNLNIRTTLFSRLNDRREGRIILIMQRVHQDDPTGNLMKDGGWTVVKLPAEAKQPIEISLNGKTWRMEPGQLLFPARLNRSELDKIRQEMTELNYAGQYLQEPVPVGGGEFRPEWIQHYGRGINVTRMNICILVDPAGGEELNKRKRKTSDWTAMMVVGLGQDGNRYLLDAVRDRLNPTERVDTLFMLHRRWLAMTNRPAKVGYERYGMMTDTHYIRLKMQQESYNFSLVELGGSMMKEERIRKLIPDMQQNRWFFPDTLLYVDGEGRTFDLVKEIMESEMATFPRSRHDDMLDALSRIYAPELDMTFPKPKSTAINRALSTSSAQDSRWEAF